MTDSLQHEGCQDTVGGRISNLPDISFELTVDFDGDCQAYHQSVLKRSGRDDNNMTGAVKVHDDPKSFFQLLEKASRLLLFQLDHGEDAKG